MYRKGNSTAFFTVVYPAVIDFLDDFFVSLEKQSERSFDVVVFNDGLSGFDFDKYNLSIHIICCSGTPADIRTQGINYLVRKGYNFVVFGDSDDYFDRQRVEQSLALLEHYDVVVNDLTLVDQAGRTLVANYLSQRIKHLEVIPFDFIAERNVFGLSNTAIRLSVVGQVSCPSELIAVDWYLFSLLLSNGASAVFNCQGTTFYRQHGSNTAGLQEMTSRKALAGIRCKGLHYLAMANTLPEMSRIGTSYQKLLSTLESDAQRCREYLERIVSNKKDFPFWWEEILLLEEFL